MQMYASPYRGSLNPLVSLSHRQTIPAWRQSLNPLISLSHRQTIPAWRQSCKCSSAKLFSLTTTLVVPWMHRNG
eukprot:1161758-Pelagomonas_calceolata.AAC.2